MKKQKRDAEVKEEEDKSMIAGEGKISTWLKPLTAIVGDESTALKVLTFIEDQERQERERRREIQKEGIRLAREKGVNLGRPRKVLPSNYERIYKDFMEKHITAEQASDYCGIGLSTFYRKVKAYKKEHNL